MNTFRALVISGVASVCAACAGFGTAPRQQGEFAYPQSSDASANDVLFRALGLVGTPYRYGGNTPSSGFDCSGLVDYVFRSVAGIPLPRTAAEISRIDAPEIDLGHLKSGDIVYFHGHSRRVTHVGIYVGNGRFVHAPNRGGTVRLDHLDSPYWRDHFSGARRVLR